MPETSGELKMFDEEVWEIAYPTTNKNCPDNFNQWKPFRADICKTTGKRCRGENCPIKIIPLEVIS